MSEEKIKKLEEEIRVVSAELLGYEQNIDELRKQLKDREDDLRGHFQDDGKWNEITSQISEYREQKESTQKKVDKLREKLEKSKEKLMYHKKKAEEID
ncbi:MAG TPA: hypothetical protein PK466_04305 [Thermotogota bacterium]|nr:hypothetical protein [Thermotogota bacterium]HPR95527.1 hypothetical protein [Thermotogota bacterium]